MKKIETKLRIGAIISVMQGYYKDALIFIERLIQLKEDSNAKYKRKK